MAGFENISNNSAAPGIPQSTNLQIVVGTTCALSILGSLFIIMSYGCFKSLRTPVRQILVHLSLMDLGVATANLVGVAVNFHQYYVSSTPAYRNGLIVTLNVPKAVDIACKVQAGVAIYCTNGSFMWTLCMAVFLYIRIVHHRVAGATKRLMLACMLWSYIFPLAITTWKFAMNRVGYSPYSSSGWCGDLIFDWQTGKSHVMTTIFGYDIWVYLTFVLVPVLYVAVYLHVQQELQNSVRFMSPEKFWALLHSLDYKLLLIPVMFLLLRVWSCVIAIFYVYGHFMPQDGPLYTAIVYLAGIGDSGQGAANAILFVFFTKRVRRKLLLPCFKYKDSVSTRASLANSINAANTPVKSYMAINKKSPGTYVDSSYHALDSD